MGVDYSV